MSPHLFSYGTLQFENVQLETYGRLLVGKPDRLPGYKIQNLRISDKSVIEKSGTDVHPIAVKTSNPNDFFDGVIFEISEKELLETDKYEVSDYSWVLEVFESGSEAWVYVKPELV